MIPPHRLNPFQFWAGDGQGKGRGARAVGPPGGGKTGNTPAPGAGQGTGTAGAGPQSRSCQGALDSPGKAGRRKSLWLSSQPSQAWCSSLLGGLPALSTSLLLTPQHKLQVGNLCFPVFLSKDNLLQYAQLGRGLQLPPATPYFASSRLSPSPMESQRLFSTVGCSRGVGKSCQATAAPRGAGALSGPSRTERLRQGGDRIFFSFFLFIKRLKQESTATNTKVSRGSGGSGTCPVAGRMTCWKEVMACAQRRRAGVPPRIHKNKNVTKKLK